MNRPGLTSLFRRRGAAAPLVAVSSTLLVGMAALTIDGGMLYRARTELQASADAAALAAALELASPDRLRGAAYMTDEWADARAAAADYALRNRIMGSAPTVDLNSGNATNGDVVIGYLSEPNNLAQPLSFSEPDKFNTVMVRVRRNNIRNGPINMLFANIFGVQTVNLGAEAAAILEDGVVGFKVTSKTGNAGLLPLSLHVNAWTNLLNGMVTIGDLYSYDPVNKTVSAGPDGIPELNLYPGSGATQLPPGNFGTVDIGSSNNSTADLSRQIRYGISAEDLAYFGGELKLGSDGTLLLNGDTGLSAAIKDDLESIKGKPRTIPLFNKVEGPGNNSMFTVVGFAGIRIMNVKLTGAMSKKQVVIQPAFVIDNSAISGVSSSVPRSGVSGPVRLVR
jgi:Flp pilus assembly protein TadG